MHYYQFHIGDYATHTRHLTPIEDIAYRRLLDIYYLHERPLSDCLTTVARQINMREYEAEVGLVLTEFFDHGTKSPFAPSFRIYPVRHGPWPQSMPRRCTT